MIVSKFFDITIIFNSSSKYNRTHFHAEYKDYSVIVDISEYEIIEGCMPRRPSNLILGWCSLHKDELM